MKLFAFIMAVVFLALNCIPCKDEAFLLKTEKTKTELHQKHSETQEHNDYCSPFCTCSCCSVLSITPLLTSINIGIPTGVPDYSSLYLGSVIEISLPIWQPPQLVV